MDVSIVTLPERRLAALSHHGAYPEIGQTFQALYAKIADLGLFPQIGEAVAIIYDDPSTTAVDALRSDAGVTLKDGVSIPEGLNERIILAGKAAKVLLKGPYSGLPAVYDHLYGAWLASSGEAPADHPSYEIYLNDPTNTPPEELLTEIVLPLR